MARMNWDKVRRQRQFSHENVTVPAEKYGHEDYDWNHPGRMYYWQLPVRARARRRAQQMARTGPGRMTSGKSSRKRRMAAAMSASAVALSALIAVSAVLLSVVAGKAVVGLVREIRGRR